MIRRTLLLCIFILAPILSAAPAMAQQDLAQPTIRGVSGSLVGWSPVAGANGYRVRWSKPKGARTFKTLPASPALFTMTNLEAGAKYEVQVRALGDGVNYEKKGKWSKKYSFTAPANPAQGPLELPAPPNFRLVTGTTFAWDAVPGATSYRIRWIAPDGTTKGKGLSASTTQYVIKRKRLVAGAVYNVQVRARGDGVNYEKKGPWSGVAQVQA